jgi:hypothetical protein
MSAADISTLADALNGFSEGLRRSSKECSGYEPSLSVLQRSAAEAADLIDALTLALANAQSPILGLLRANAGGKNAREMTLKDGLCAVRVHITKHLDDLVAEFAADGKASSENGQLLSGAHRA